MRTLPAWVEIDLDALASNIAEVRRAIGSNRKVLMIVKADAYGHGAVEVASAAVHQGVHMLGVATVDEGRELRRAGIDAAILVLSPVLPEEIPALLDADLRMTIPDLNFAQALSEAAQQRGKIVPVHIEVDTGMGRSGFNEAVAIEWVRHVDALPGVLIEGLYTHFPVSDTDVEFTCSQCKRLGALVNAVRAAGVEIPLVHASNTAGVLQLPELHLDMVRPGGMIYGCLPHRGLSGRANLQSVMSFRARLVQVRNVPPRTPISYGSDVMTRQEVVLGVVPVGYGHGFSRANSYRGSMLFRGRRVAILGRVTMDMTMIDLSQFDAPSVGEEVVLFGRQGDAEISVDEVGERTGVIGYEVLCSISKRVVRAYRRNGRVDSIRGLTGVRRAATPG